MFVGHLAVSLFARSAQAHTPLWSHILGAELIDIGWWVL